MRNLKRALSLALASVMLLGMMVVGSSAKGIDDFTDKAEIVNQDAVAVTSAIGMFEGYEDGSRGQLFLKRAQRPADFLLHPASPVVHASRAVTLSAFSPRLRHGWRSSSAPCCMAPV